MKPAKPKVSSYPKKPNLEQSLSTPELAADPQHLRLLKKSCDKVQTNIGLLRSPKEGRSTSDTEISARKNASPKEPVRLDKEPKKFEDREGGDMPHVSPGATEARWCKPHNRREDGKTRDHKQIHSLDQKNTQPRSPLDVDSDDPWTRQIRDIHHDAKKSSRIIRDSRARLLELRKKPSLSDADIKELGDRNDLLLREMERFDRLTRSIQKLVGNQLSLMKKKTPAASDHPPSLYEPSLYHEMKMAHPTVLLAGSRPLDPLGVIPTHHHHSNQTRSKSEIDLTRKLNESYDMQEKLVADNADLEVKRYILYKELMTKDQNLETSRNQVKRLQGELKLMGKENALLHEKLDRNNPKGDATLMNYDRTGQLNSESEESDVSKAELVRQLEKYKSSTLDLEKQLGELEVEVRVIRVDMDSIRNATSAPGSACRGGGGANTCFKQPTNGPPVPPMSRACGVCPPCPAPCNPNAPPTPAEREVAKLSIQLKQTEENFKTKVTECALLRADLMKKKEELEKERCMHREVQNKLRDLEMRFEGLTQHTNMLLGTKEQAFETEVNVRALKQCYREAREEIDELRTVMKEQNEQLQDYRVKYMQAQQLVEEQRRQMDMMDMDNTRISEQINLEIQKVKLKFQEKLQELSPIPDLLKATQMKLKDAQQSQALAEHNAEQLARELACAREKVHMLLHTAVKPPEKVDKAGDEKQISFLNQRISQLTEGNYALKGEIERLKANVIRMEESVLANEKRLNEKMHECAQLGGELDRARDEAARALARANERTDTIRKCMQTTVAELERQLASARAQVKTAEKNREEIQNRMTCQIGRLNDNFEQAQLRILGLQTQVQTLRRTASSTGEGGDGENQDCACKSFFNED